jgi:hypothetical protein
MLFENALRFVLRQAALELAAAAAAVVAHRAQLGHSYNVVEKVWHFLEQRV